MLFLILNSIEAMPAGGKLNVLFCRDGEYYVLTVKDTGVGIPKDAQSKLVMSMFTIKAQGQGFG
jgi:signal transduction histidine kinase